jgi:hypothetical protein
MKRYTYLRARCVPVGFYLTITMAFGNRAWLQMGIPEGFSVTQVIFSTERYNADRIKQDSSFIKQTLVLGP